MSVRSDAINQLFDAYGTKPKHERIAVYEKWARNTDVEVVSRVIDFVIGEDPRVPPVSRLYVLSREMSAKRAKDVDEVDCWFCDGTGQIPGIWQTEQGEWTHGVISACKCSNGDRVKSKYIPKNIFEHDPRYIDLMKIGKKHKASPWGAVPCFYQELRGKQNATT